MQGDMQKQLAILTAERDINKLQAQYGALCDDGYPSSAIANLFVPDGIWERRSEKDSHGAIYRGRGEISENFERAPKRFPWALHINIPRGVTVADDGVSATGSWHIVMPCIVNGDLEQFGAWVAGRYENDFVKTDGAWYFKHMRMHYSLMVPKTRDWADDRLLLMTGR